MKLLYNPVFLEHDTGMHPENKKRLETFTDIHVTDVQNGEKYLSLFHTKRYISHVKAVSVAGGHLDPDTIVSPGTYKAAVHAVGATIDASKNGDFALVRPPGHHAHPDRSSGFCVFNNIVIATEMLRKKGKKVLIFDFDGHLGDGTEAFYFASNEVLYWSFHENTAFPGGGRIMQIGQSKGKGYTINIPLPQGSGDDMFLRALDMFMPVATSFKPDVVAVSAGFDGHKSDLLLHLRFTVNLYYQIGKRLAESFPHVFATLEGGYNLIYLPQCVRNFVDGVNRKTQTYSEPETDSSIPKLEEFETQMKELKELLVPYWNVW